MLLQVAQTPELLPCALAPQLCETTAGLSPAVLLPSAQVEKQTALIILGPDKVVVGDFCATIRRQRPPEPYKGKGVRFAGEVIKLKVGVLGLEHTFGTELLHDLRIWDEMIWGEMRDDGDDDESRTLMIVAKRAPMPQELRRTQQRYGCGQIYIYTNRFGRQAVLLFMQQNTTAYVNLMV